jgi:hypothetical protein
MNHQGAVLYRTSIISRAGLHLPQNLQNQPSTQKSSTPSPAYPRKDHHTQREKITKESQWLKSIHYYRQLYQYLRGLLVINTLKFLHARRPTTAVNLLHGRRFVQDLLIINRAGLEDLDPAESFTLDPHDGPAGAAVVIGDALAGVASASEGAVGAG